MTLGRLHVHCSGVMEDRACKVDFQHFSLWEDMVVLKGVILDNFDLGRVWWS